MPQQLLKDLLMNVNHEYKQSMDKLKSNYSLDKVEQNFMKLFNDFLGKVIGELLQALFADSDIMYALKIWGGKRGLRFKSFRLLRIMLGCGVQVKVMSPYFISKNKKRGRKKAGPNGSGAHLGLELLGCTGQFSKVLVSRVGQAALLAPSFEVASNLLKEWGISRSASSVRYICQLIGKEGLKNRGAISLKGTHEFTGKTMVISADGGRIRERKNKRGRRPKGMKQQGYHTEWKEPKLFTIYLLDADGHVVKAFKPIHDATMGNHEGMFELLKKYIDELDIKQLDRIVFTADGAPWIWQGIEKRCFEWFEQRGFPIKDVYQVLDYTHANQHLNQLLEYVPKAKHQATIANWRTLLWAGNIDGLKDSIALETMRGKKRKDALNHWKNYFDTNRKRMRYAFFKEQGLVCGSGCVESAIRRVINLRLKAPGSFWLKEMAETFLFLRSQLISGRWEIFMDNLKALKIKDFKLVRA
ncbi:MAG: hypothetical protein Q9M28_01150 [Mariprofundaceae bacterium]|nr:hypothetical protein [Mariprofundaceae bacterium]